MINPTNNAREEDAAVAEKVTHSDLVERAVRWLRNSENCGVVIAEARNCGAEQPDAIGWKYGGHYSVLVECKVSRPDFFADRKKTFRKAWAFGVGRHRYYMTPPGLVTRDEVPAGWGLLEVSPRNVRRIKRADQRELSPMSISYERAALYSALGKVQNPAWDASKKALSVVRASDGNNERSGK